MVGPVVTEVATDRTPAYPRVLDELLPTACHVTEQDANDPIEADHGRLKTRLRPMRRNTAPQVSRPPTVCPTSPTKWKASSINRKSEEYMTFCC